jgi:hypothetical protein
MENIVEPFYKVEDSQELKSVKNFRKIISKFKKRIFNELDSSDLEGDKRAQQLINLDNAVKYIKNFGHILMNILNTKNNEAHEVIKMCNDNDVDILNLSYEERDLCKHYVYMDIYTYPYDINNHVTSSTEFKYSL